jgi:hypothetical protein
LPSRVIVFSLGSLLNLAFGVLGVGL